MYALERVDVRTCGEILRLYSESMTTTNRTEKRNHLKSIFSLMLVFDENNRMSWTFEDLYTLWRHVMTEKDASPPPCPSPCLQKHHVPNASSISTTPTTPNDRETLPRRQKNNPSDDDHLLDFYMDDEVFEHDNRGFELFMRREIKRHIT